MNRLCLLFVAAGMLSLAPLARAQHAFGIVGGLNLANVSVDPNEGVDFSNRTAMGIGGMVELQLANNTALRLEPMYLQKGAEAQFGGDAAKLKLAYLEVPALLKYSFGNASARPYVLAGPSLGFLLNAKVAADGQEEDIKDELNSVDFGLNFGAGMSFPAGKNTLFVEGRYALGLSNMIKNSGSSNESAKNRGMQFMAGISFPLGSK